MREIEPVSRWTTVGDIAILGVADGSVFLSPDYYSGVDWERHREMLSPNGTIDRPIGCFLIVASGQTVLVDAGVGPRSLDWASGGELPEALEKLGLDAGPVKRVICTHAHIDHIGGLVRKDLGPLANARLGLGRREFASLDERGSGHSRHAIGEFLRRGMLDLLDDGDLVAPGVSVRATPGHTVGHLSVVVSSGAERAVILGDVVICPEEIPERWINRSDDDPEVSATTRARLWPELAATHDLVVGSHFPGLAFGRVITEGSGHVFVPEIPNATQPLRSSRARKPVVNA